MIKVSDYIAKRLAEHYGVKHFFMVSGGGAMHLNDSLGRYIPYTANHHEQACSIAAEGYARVNQTLGVVNVTTGPGGLNCLNGVFGEWTDSVPVLYISGQVKFSTSLASQPDRKLRQLGDQEVDIISTVKHLTKYAAMIENPLDVKYHLDRAIWEAMNGRFGPVWLDVPMNVQGAMVEQSQLRDFIPPKSDAVFEDKIPQVVKLLGEAKKPLIVAGHGIRLSSMVPTFKKLVQKAQIPVVTTFNGFDLLSSDDPLFAGRIGTVGQRCGNFTLQNADCILFLGTRNNIRQVSYNWENFAKNAVKIVVDIDSSELNKPLVKPDVSVNADLSLFLPKLLECLGKNPNGSWLDFCINLRKKYFFENAPEYAQKNDSPINVYNFVRTLTQELNPPDIMTAANGSACVCLHQVGVVKFGERIFWNGGDASMGYGLPAAIGAYYAQPDRKVVCLEGDGSIMMNLQELQTVAHNKIPLKIFIIANGAYASIKQTQRNFFEGRMTGSNPESGVGVPDFCKLASAFGLESVRISGASEMRSKIREVLDSSAPVVCQIECETDYSFSPKLSAKKLPDGTMVSPSLEDMFPFLDREEFKSNLF